MYKARMTHWTEDDSSSIRHDHLQIDERSGGDGYWVIRTLWTGSLWTKWTEVNCRLWRIWSKVHEKKMIVDDLSSKCDSSWVNLEGQTTGNWTKSWVAKKYMVRKCWGGRFGYQDRPLSKIVQFHTWPSTFGPWTTESKPHGPSIFTLPSTFFKIERKSNESLTITWLKSWHYECMQDSGC